MYGLRVTGLDGRLQVYSEGANLCLHSKGVFFIDRPDINDNWKRRLPLNTVLPEESLLFIRPTVSGRVIYSQIEKDALGRAVLVFGSEVSSEVQWYVFSTPQQSFAEGAGGKYGLRVYKSDGSLSFSTVRPLLRLSGLAKIPDGVDVYGEMPSFDLTLAPGRVYAGCITVSREYVDTEGPPMGGGPYSYHHYDGITTGSNYVGVRNATLGAIATDAGTVFMPYGGLILAADVTGY